MQNELFSNAARTSGSIDCGHFNPGDAEDFELRDRSLPHHNRNIGIDTRPLVTLILSILINNAASWIYVRVIGDASFH